MTPWTSDAVWRAREADLLIEWARGATHPDGGFGWRAADGTILTDRGRPLWLTCRMIHCLGLGVLRGRDSLLPDVEAGVRALDTVFRDREHGGWFSDADRPATGRKEAYGHAFAVLAGATATVCGAAGGRALLAESLEVIDARFWDAGSAMPYDSWDLAFTTPDSYRGGNGAMHLVEALLAAADATDDDGLRKRAAAICGRMIGAAAERGWRVPEHFDEHWRVVPDYNVDRPRDPFRPHGATPGHAMEWARLLLTLDATRPDLVPDARGAAISLAHTAFADAWDGERGGFVYTTDFDGVPVVRERFHWVTCEATATSWALGAVTGDPEWARWYTRAWEFARASFVDPTMPGGWRHELSAVNEPVALTWPDRPDAYHALQACLLPDLPVAPGLARALAER